jgi:hypothetical protein
MILTKACSDALMKRTVIASLVFLLAGFANGAERNSRFVKKLQVPRSSEIVVVTEGEFEPRSIGSYTLKIYGGGSKQFPTDDFIAGVVRARNGTIEAVRFDDIDGDNRPEIVVIIRSAGSGGYLSAEAFRYRARSLELVISVADLDKRADPIQAMRDKFKSSTEPQSVP